MYGFNLGEIIVVSLDIIQEIKTVLVWDVKTYMHFQAIFLSCVVAYIYIFIFFVWILLAERISLREQVKASKYLKTYEISLSS